MSPEELRPSIYRESQPALIAASRGKSRVDLKVEDYQVLAESVLGPSRWSALVWRMDLLNDLLNDLHRAL